MFRVGQEAAFDPVNPNGWHKWIGSSELPPRPAQGDTFVIVGVGPSKCFTCALRFAEFPGIAFDARDWKPVVKTDISIFTEMLVKPPRETVLP